VSSAPVDASVDHPADVSLAWATWSLFAGLGLLLVGGGLFATVVGVRAERNGYTNLEIGLLGIAYYGGFLAGSKLTISALPRVGHIRVYAALTSLLSATMIAVGLNDSAVAWIALRWVSGVCIAGTYVVAESWLNQLATNESRGRLLAVYMVVTSGSYGFGQVLVGSVNTRTVTAFAVAALLTCLAIAPVALSEDAVPPPLERSSKVPLRLLATVVPTGIGTCLLVGVAHGALVGMGVIYATRAGLSASAAGHFVAATAVGGVLAQWPISAASDELDRRFVGCVVAIAAIGAGVWLLSAGPKGWSGLAAMGLLGGLSLPLYSIASAYTNDWVEPQHVNGAASQLVLVYGAGALAGPPLTSMLFGIIGTAGFPWAMIGLHGIIVAFLVYRMIAWRSPISKTSWTDASYSTRVFFIPANVVWMSRRLSRRPRRRRASHRP
jgi:MFS family permease